MFVIITIIIACRIKVLIIVVNKLKDLLHTPVLHHMQQPQILPLTISMIYTLFIHNYTLDYIYLY